MILLTDEEIKKIRIETDNLISKFCNSVEGNFNQADILAMYEDGEKELIKAQLRKVVEEIDKKGWVYNGLGDYRIPNRLWQQLRKEAGIDM